MVIHAAWKSDLRRVAVVGTSGCGKTTVARELSAVLDVPHIELDALYWQPHWVARPAGDFRDLVECDQWRHIRFSEFRRPSQTLEFLSRCRDAARQGAATQGQPASGVARG